MDCRLKPAETLFKHRVFTSKAIEVIRPSAARPVVFIHFIRNSSLSIRDQSAQTRHRHVCPKKKDESLQYRHV